MTLASESPLIELNEVSKHFVSGVRVLSNVSLAVFKKEFVSILGPSGCGKSTILRLAAGLDVVSTGKVQTPALMAKAEGATAFVFQEPHLRCQRSPLHNERY